MEKLKQKYFFHIPAVQLNIVRFTYSIMQLRETTFILFDVKIKYSKHLKKIFYQYFIFFHFLLSVEKKRLFIYTNKWCFETVTKSFSFLYNINLFSYFGIVSIIYQVSIRILNILKKITVTTKFKT